MVRIRREARSVSRGACPVSCHQTVRLYSTSANHGLEAVAVSHTRVLLCALFYACFAFAHLFAASLSPWRETPESQSSVI